jgi:hypothetical protein
MPTPTPQILQTLISVALDALAPTGITDEQAIIVKRHMANAYFEGVSDGELQPEAQ